LIPNRHTFLFWFFSHSSIMATAAQIIDLVTGWKLKRTDEGDDTWLPVEKVPTVVHLDLLSNKRHADL
jgi:hypothetical protein